MRRLIPAKHSAEESLRAIEARKKLFTLLCTVGIGAYSAGLIVGYHVAKLIQ